MISNIIAFFTGVLYLQTFKALPAYYIDVGLLLWTVILFFLIKPIRRLSCLLIFFLLGFVYTHLIASFALHTELSPYMKLSLEVSGEVVSIPTQTPWGKTFLFKIERVNMLHHQINELVQLRLPKSIALQPHPGQVYQCHVKLKNIHGLQNPGGFDYEAWAMQKGIKASGTILRGSEITLIRQKYTLTYLRWVLQQKILSNLPASKASQWLVALMVGEHGAVDSKDWQVLKMTGTNHLMAIAGLHIGAIALWCFMVVKCIWRIPRLIYFMPAETVARLSACIVAVVYSAIAGFSLPTVRASTMFVILTAFNLKRLKISFSQVFSLALLSVLLLNPLSVLTTSFWLSFGTIFLIHYGMSHRYQPRGWWWKWSRVQWVVGIGLVPLTLLLFQQFSLVSFIANSFAIPWLSFLILPFCFMAMLTLCISERLTQLLLLIADFNFKLMWRILKMLSNVTFAAIDYGLTTMTDIFIVIVCILLFLLPRGVPGKLFIIFLLVPFIINRAPRLETADFNVTFLDVGQGLAVVVQTKNHVLLYDTGPGNLIADSGEKVILPFLLQKKVQRIDTMIISHPDGDHIGGAASILKKFPHTRLYASSTKKLTAYPVLLCNTEHEWQWDGILFKFLHPARDDELKGNNRSCVLLIKNHVHQVLLTGDIERRAEKILVARYPDLRSEVISIPHHGSSTSTTDKMLTTLAPSIAVIGLGYENQFHFPHALVLKRLSEHHVKVLQTAKLGAITLEFKGAELDIDSYRLTHRKYWYRR